GPARHLDDGLGFAALVDGAHLMEVEIREPQLAATPARALAEGKTSEQRFELHGTSVVSTEGERIRSSKRRIGLRPYQPGARRVYQPGPSVTPRTESVIAATRPCPGAPNCVRRPHLENAWGVSAPVTLLFPDLVDSTELLQRVGDERAQRIFRAHHRLL